jgi:zinc ribbon protein
VIVCKNCGHQNDDNDTFCGSCGKFLEWTGERVAIAEPEPELPPAPPPAPEPTHLGLIDRVKQAVGLEEEEPPTAQATVTTVASPPPAPHPPAPAPVASTPPSAPILRQVPIMSTAPPPPAPQPVAPAPAMRTPAPATPAPSSSMAADPIPSREPVLAGVGAPVSPAPAVPVHDDEPMSRRPTSVAPAVARPRTAPRTLEAPTRRRPGDLICGQCGEGNDPTRHFCRRCGHSLDEAIAVQLSWYRRIWNRLFGPRTYEAGYRHRRVGPPNVLGAIWRVVRLVLLAIIVVALLGFALIPSFRTTVINRATNAVNPLRVQFFPHYDAVYATGATASTSTAGHLPALAVDHFLNTYWAASASDARPYLKILFLTPVDLAKIGFDSGPSGTTPADSFPNQPRPKAVHVVCSDGTTADLTLRDEDPSVAKNAQFYTLNAKQVTFVEIFIETTYPPAGASPSSVAISEVEFKTRD